jgi:hypothetical protein
LTSERDDPKIHESAFMFNGSGSFNDAAKPGAPCTPHHLPITAPITERTGCPMSAGTDLNGRRLAATLPGTCRGLAANLPP